MAKRHRKKIRKKRERAERALTELARALDKCDSYQVKLKHGIAMSIYGYVIPFKSGWKVRMLAESGFSDDYDD